MGRGKTLADKEKRKAMLKDKKDLAAKVAKLGLAYEEDEIPPDEIDRDEVAKSLVHTIKAMVPGTQEYYEAKKAEEEMDDLFQIEVEKARAKELISKTRVGRHDEALEEMMDETDHDFHYFNKIKHRQTLEGTFQYSKPEADPFKYMERGQNRIRKAVRMQFGLMDEGLMRKLSVHGRNMSSTGNKLQQDKDLPCTWKGVGPDDEVLLCSNSRGCHSTKTVANRRGVEEPAWQGTCYFHALSCLGNHEEEYPPRIITPNAEGLCNECYIHKLKTLPPMCSSITAPGVYNPSLENAAKNAIISVHGSQAGDESEEIGSSVADNKILESEEIRKGLEVDPSGLTEESLCCWVPSAEESLTHMRGYICRHKVFRNPVTKLLMRTCAMHVKFCVKPHLEGAVGGVIEIPNVYALCNMHHVSECGVPPTEVPFPFPGMQYRLRGKGWMIKAGHWAAPSWPPLQVTKCNKVYRKPKKPIGFMNEMREAARVMTWKKRKKQMGKYAATAIQAHYRGYRVRFTHRMMILQRKVPLRIERAIVIQSAMRRFLGHQIVSLRRNEFKAAALFIQRCYRGYVVRRWLRRQRAARVLQKASKTFKDRQFFNTVMMLVQLRKLFQRRDLAVVIMQKIVRGHITRKQIKRHRMKTLMQFHRAARIMQMAFRTLMRFRERQRRIAEKRDKTLFMRKLAQLIEELYFQREDRRALIALMQNSAPVMQCLVRGYIGRTRAKRMLYLREAIRSWCKPIFAVDFMKQQLERKITYLSCGSTSVMLDDSAFDLKPASMKRQDRQPVTFLFEFIPEHLKKGFCEVDKNTLFDALAKWYQKIRKPLLASEMESIYQRFRNAVDGKVTIPVLDEYIKKHKMPCRKHARVVCGDCVYFRDCNISGCLCKCFKRDEKSGTSCKLCHHSIILHTMFPLDLKPTRKKMGKTLLDILNTVTDTDLSLPTIVSGIELNDIGREIYQKKWNIKKSIKSAKMLEVTESSVLEDCGSLSESAYLVKSLSMLDVSGAVMADNKEYWAQKHPHLPVNEGPDMVQIHACDVPPPTDLTQAQFWQVAPKNPNKSVRDYHEKFDHSMPVPIVTDGEVMFTLEGAAAYVQLLRRIVHIHEKDPRRGIHHDSGDFLRLIVDHIQLFERHWRKMVVDIRQGELNRHVNISENARILYSSTAMPRPALAKKLDTAFRNLGFHMKVLGKDIVMKGYASRKKPKQSEFRRPSFPENTLGSTGFGSVDFAHSRDSITSAVSIADDKNLEVFTPGATLGSSKSSTNTALMSASIENGIEIKRNLKHFDSTPVSFAAIQTMNEFGFDAVGATAPSAGETGTNASFSRGVTANRTSGKKKKKFKKMEAMVLANTIGTAAAKELKEREMMKEARGATANRRNFVRRGSDTDVLRPSTVEELRKIEHSIITEPRIDYHNLIAVGGRFICPFPACGQSYTSRDSAFEHLRTHEQRRRLYAPSPLSDSHMNFYWPRDNSWRDGPKYTRRVLPPGAITCTVKGCQEVFLSNHRLEYHLKLAHNQESTSSLLKSFFKYLGKNTATPPYPPPPYAPAEFCSSHLKLDKKCPKCNSILTVDVPHQPMNYYDSVRVDFNKRDGRGGDILVERAGGDKGLFCKVKSAAGKDRIVKGRPVGMLKDCHHDGWVAVQEVVTIVEAQENKRRVPKDADIHHEVVTLHESDGSGTTADPGAPMWVRLVEVTGYFYLIETTKDDFRFRVRNGEIPKENVYFIRPDRSRAPRGYAVVEGRPVSPDTGANELTLPPI